MYFLGIPRVLSQVPSPSGAFAPVGICERESSGLTAFVHTDRGDLVQSSASDLFRSVALGTLVNNTSASLDITRS